MRAIAVPKPAKRLKHFRWMSVYWSIPAVGWEALQKAVQDDQGFYLLDLGARELRCRPHGLVENFRDVEPRTEQNR